MFNSKAGSVRPFTLSLVFAVMLALLIGCSSQNRENQDKIVQVELGQKLVPVGYTIKHEIVYQNRSGATFHLKPIRRSCGCIVAKCIPDTVESGKSCSVFFELNTSLERIKKSENVYFSTGVEEIPEIGFEIRGDFIPPAYATPNYLMVQLDDIQPFSSEFEVGFFTDEVQHEFENKFIIDSPAGVEVSVVSTRTEQYSKLKGKLAKCKVNVDPRKIDDKQLQRKSVVVRNGDKKVAIILEVTRLSPIQAVPDAIMLRPESGFVANTTIKGSKPFEVRLASVFSAFSVHVIQSGMNEKKVKIIVKNPKLLDWKEEKLEFETDLPAYPKFSIPIFVLQK